MTLRCAVRTERGEFVLDATDDRRKDERHRHQRAHDRFAGKVASSQQPGERHTGDESKAERAE